MAYKITHSEGKQAFPADLWAMLNEIDADVWTANSNKPDSMDVRAKVVAETKARIDRWVTDRLIQDGTAVCDASVNHPKIWNAGECYMIVVLTLTPTLSVVVRYYIGSPDHDRYFRAEVEATTKPVPFAILRERHELAKAVLAKAREEAEAACAAAYAACPHEVIMNKECHVRSTHIDRGYTAKWQECTFCGKKVNSPLVIGTYS